MTNKNNDYLVDEDFEGLTEEEIVEKLRAQMEAEAESVEESRMSTLERLHKKNPALKDAWNQLRVIKKLVGENDFELGKNSPAWERSFMQIVSEVEAGESENPQVQDAFERYKVLKNLIVPNDGENND